MFRVAALVLFVMILVALFSSLVFLLRDSGGSHRTANTLMIRVLLSAALIALLLFGFFSGQLHPHAPW